MAVEILGDDFDCRKCDGKLKEERGCERKGIIPFHIDNERIYRCPKTLITSISWEYIKAYSFFEKNMLPNGNAYNKESNKYLQSMMVLTNEFNRERKENARRKT